MTLILLVLKLTLVLLLGAATTTLLRNRSASTRHVAWALTIAGSLILAVAAETVPNLPVHLPQWAQRAEISQPSPAVSSAPVLVVVTRRAIEPKMKHDPSIAQRVPARFPIALPVALWLAGTAAMLLWLAAGHGTVARILRSATDGNEEASLLLDSALREIGVERPVRLVFSPLARAPFTSGALHPVIILPATSALWPAERRRAALLHEAAHIARRDALLHLLAGLATALYWFHPGIWVAARALRREAEQATDDLVVERGMAAAEYAGHLLEVAAAARRGSVPFAAVAMACPSNLERRVRALLDDNRSRNLLPFSRSILAAALAMLVVIPIAAARPESQGNTHESRTSVRSANTVEKSVSAQPGGRLVIDLETGGGVEITPGDDHAVTMHGDLSGRDADRTIVGMEVVGNEVRMSSRVRDSGGSSSTSHSFRFRVPSRFDVAIRSAGGEIVIRDLRGVFEGQTGGGEINLQRLQGRAHLSTGGGDIDVRDSVLDGEVSTGGGKVRIEGVRGNLRGDSGNEPIEFSHRYVDDDDSDFPPVPPVPPVPAVPAVPAVPPVPAAPAAPPVPPVPEGAPLPPVPPVPPLPPIPGDGFAAYARSGNRYNRTSNQNGFVEISQSGGAIDLQDAPAGASLSTGGGRIRLGHAGGNVDVSTGGGRIDLEHVAGSAQARTGAGDVNVVIAPEGRGSRDVDVVTGSGDVVVTLPHDFEGQFDIETAYTEEHSPVSIRADWNLEHDPVTGLSAREGTPRRYVRAHGSAGSGSNIVRIRAVNGNVTIRRD